MLTLSYPVEFTILFYVKAKQSKARRPETDLTLFVYILTAEITEFPRAWKNTLLFHGVPFKKNESFYLLGYTVADIISKTLGVREEVTPDTFALF